MQRDKARQDTRGRSADRIHPVPTRRWLATGQTPGSPAWDTARRLVSSTRGPDNDAVDRTEGTGIQERKLRLPQAFADEIVAHAREELPNAACGAILGRNGRPLKLYRAVNAKADAIGWSVGGKDLLRIYREGDQYRWAVIAIYHSHTCGEACPTAEDVRLCEWPEAHHLIVSMAGGATPALRSFRIVEGHVTEDELEIPPAGDTGWKSEIARAVRPYGTAQIGPPSYVDFILSESERLLELIWPVVAPVVVRNTEERWLGHRAVLDVAGPEPAYFSMENWSLSALSGSMEITRPGSLWGPWRGWIDTQYYVKQLLESSPQRDVWVDGELLAAARKGFTLPALDALHRAEVGIVPLSPLSIGQPTFSPGSCLTERRSLIAPLHALCQLTIMETGEVKEQMAHLADVPLMTPEGTFIVDGKPIKGEPSRVAEVLCCQLAKGLLRAAATAQERMAITDIDLTYPSALIEPLDLSQAPLELVSAPDREGRTPYRQVAALLNLLQLDNVNENRLRLPRPPAA
jgi:proteasome lid subunit RPN8/RPN11